MLDDVNIMDTQYGHLLVLQERELKVTLEGMTQEKEMQSGGDWRKCPQI
jgi:hypothetical protein